MVRKNVTIDWTLKENVQAKLRIIVKRILKKYGYPPDYFSDIKLKYVRLYFYSLIDRTKALKIAFKNKLRTASNDLGSADSNYYFSKLSREKRYNTNNWNKIVDWESLIRKNDNNERFARTRNCAYEFNISYKDLKPLNDNEIKEINRDFNEKISNQKLVA